jgi:hypothetical protein
MLERGKGKKIEQDGEFDPPPSPPETKERPRKKENEGYVK